MQEQGYTGSMPDHDFNVNYTIPEKPEGGLQPPTYKFFISIRDIWFIIIVSIWFFLLTIYTLIKICSMNLPFYRRMKLGYRYKVIFLLVLVLSLLLRSLGNVAVYVIHTMMGLNLFWLTQLLKTLPSLLFFTAYSIFIYFFGKLWAYEENSYNMSRPMLIGLNLLAYGSFTFIALYYESVPVIEYSKILWGYYGVLYLIFCILMIIFGTKVCLIVFTKKSLCNYAIESREFKTFKSISCRVICLTTFLIIIFFIRGVYNLMFSWGLLNSIFSFSYFIYDSDPSKDGTTNQCQVMMWYTCESLFFMLSEFLPSLVTIVIMFNNNTNVFISEFDAQDEINWTNRLYDDNLGIIEEDMESSEYGSFNPNLREKLLVNDFRKNLY